MNTNGLVSTIDKCLISWFGPPREPKLKPANLAFFDSYKGPLNNPELTRHDPYNATLALNAFRSIEQLLEFRPETKDSNDPELVDWERRVAEFYWRMVEHTALVHKARARAESEKAD